MNDSDKSTSGSKKTVSVEIVSYEDKTLLVKHLVDGDLRMVYVPKTKFKDGEVEESVLKKGIPYGLPWDELEFPAISGSDLARELHKHNIWTAEDFRQKPQKARAAINQLYGKPLAILIQFINEQTK